MNLISRKVNRSGLRISNSKVFSSVHCFKDLRRCLSCLSFVKKFRFFLKISFFQTFFKMIKIGWFLESLAVQRAQMFSNLKKGIFKKIYILIYLILFELLHYTTFCFFKKHLHLRLFKCRLLIP